MKLPSVHRLVNELQIVIKRFPLEVFFAVIGSIAATALIELENNNFEYSNWCWRIIMAAEIGLLLNLSVSIFSKSHQLKYNRKLVYHSLALIITVIFLFAFDPIKKENDIVRFFTVCFGFHLLVAFAAFIGKKEKINAFWQFNKTLFLRIIIAVFYSGVLYLGLAAALGATNFLFNFSFESDTFAIMAVWIFCLFQTIFFLSGVPDNIDSLQEDNSYPKELKLFTQYVLIPLASVYAIILLSYELKILIEWNMPKGLVASLILGYAVFGILSFLLVYPLRNLDEHQWIKKYSKSFFFLLVPLLILLYLAVYTRIKDYGITESRYLLIALAVWLSFITFYFIFSRRQNIVIIPVSLCIISLLSVYGPLSAFNVSEKSQLMQMKGIFAKSKVLNREGKLQPIDGKLDSVSRERIQSISRYLITRHGLEVLQPILKDDLHRVTDSIKLGLNKKKSSRRTFSRWELNDAEYKWLSANYKLPVLYGYDEHSINENYNVIAEESEIIPLNSADFLINLNYHGSDTLRIKIGRAQTLTYRFKGNILNLRIGAESKSLKLTELLSRLKSSKPVINPKKGENDNNQTFPRSVLKEEFNLSGYRITLLFNSIRYDNQANQTRISFVDAVLLLKENRQ